jgi:hypothetical protein
MCCIASKVSAYRFHQPRNNAFKLAGSSRFMTLLEKDARQPATVLAANNNNPANAERARHRSSFPQPVTEVKPDGLVGLARDR